MKILLPVIALIFSGMGCTSPDHQTATAPFERIFVRNAASESAELILVVNHPPYGGAEYLDSFVADNAKYALREAARVSETNLSVVFFFKNGPNSDYGAWGGFSISELQSIMRDKRDGIRFDSAQDWPTIRLDEK